MTKEEAKIYFKQCNSRIISVCKDENKYDHEKQEIISNCARRTYEANRLAIQALEQKSCENCISREKAKQFLYERLDRLNNDELYDIFSTIIDDMYNELPSTIPQPFINKPCVSEGVCREDKIQVLGKIKEEIKDNTYFINERTEKEGIDFETVEKIIDKYRESEG